MSKQDEATNAVLDVINDIKKTGFTRDTVDHDSYLGGDLGVDSREMLEIWYELEQRLGVAVGDAEKRDLYTLGDVVALLQRKLEGADAGREAVAAA
ncbi:MULTISPECIES: acyl carrier protein [Lysobacter]|uniref:Acyl carrier protein n=2 Tax=Lysobacter TaxID=68 RepID=A0A0S2DFW5_LYSEN|nr:MULTISPECIES: acyl carrier protein [Lysobacter]ALN57452.1 acyl carrier protein [Lysobacter enzymogenes]QCW26054.1 acyl carrier protein [Lysobacter enzymogenes]QQP99373.1 acyl carrier protein [Lysobacter enzymogenes]UZW58820.1 acyl carrier protein [Lysobacter enzymogenes]WMT02535.1 acyl carrier protein [Lysobacter yananisis]